MKPDILEGNREHFTGIWTRDQPDSNGRHVLAVIETEKKFRMIVMVNTDGICEKKNYDRFQCLSQHSKQSAHGIWPREATLCLNICHSSRGVCSFVIHSF
jgi:hypothetical protein